jgi:nitrite reductase/ring-hydroxylating ferredoxin subunit
MSSFIKVAKIQEVPSGKVKEVKLNALIIALANSDGSFFAFEGLCTHKKCPLAGGTLTGKTLTCFCHGAQFDIQSGKVLNPPADKPLHIYKVKVEGEDILIEI